MSTNVGSIHYDLDLKTDKFEKTSRNIGGKLKTVGKTFAIGGAAAGAAFTAAFGKFVIGGGISRALNIEDAQAKLKGLGHDAKSVEKIMDSALKSVKGTAYGLDEAATISASAVAAGVKSGEELTDYLSLTADASTIAGVSLAEMGSIFNKVQTNQKAYTQELNQLADRGIPIYQWLQKEFDVTAVELREMVAKGEVDSKDYFKAIEKNISGAALESGKTTRGAWANMKAAMARVGEDIVEDTIPKIRKGLGDMTKWFDDNSEKIVEAFSNTSKTVGDFMSKAIELGTKIAEYLQPKLQALWNALNEDLVPVLKMLWEKYFKDLVAIIGTGLVIAIGLAIDAITLITTAFAGLVTWMENNKWIVVPLIGYIGTLYGVMKAKAAFRVLTASFYAISNTVIPKVMGKYLAMKALLTTPIALPALLIGAVLAAFWKIRSEFDALTDRMNAAKRSASNAQDDFLRSVHAARDRGDISRTEAARRISEYNKQMGYMTGGFTGRGAEDEIAGIVHRGEYVIPKSQVDQNTGKPKIGGGFAVYGNLNIGNKSDADYLLRKINRDQEAIGFGLSALETSGV